MRSQGENLHQSCSSPREEAFFPPEKTLFKEDGRLGYSIQGRPLDLPRVDPGWKKSSHLLFAVFPYFRLRGWEFYINSFPFPSFFRGSVNHPKCVHLFSRNPTREGDPVMKNN